MEPDLMLCSIQGCGSRKVARGWCSKHWQKFRKYGNPLDDQFGGLSREHRFWLKVAITANPDKCWEWQASRDSKGYGQYWYKGKKYIAHRLAWLLVHGILPGSQLNHKCDNRICVNPNHLYEGTQTANMQEMVQRGRHYWHARTHCKRGHDLRIEGAFKYYAQGPLCARCCEARKQKPKGADNAWKQNKILIF